MANPEPSTGSEVLTATPADRDALLYRKVIWKLVPLLFLSYTMAYLDRINVGFAKLQMLADLRFSESVYGFGAGIFFAGYLLFEVPSNLILHRFGARRWIARIMITWGALSAAMMLVKSPTSFYVLRFLLGLAEAGFFPGVILYLTYWIPPSRIGRALALFLLALPVAGVLGGPLSGWVLQGIPQAAALRGWQWMFLIEGLPSVLLGIAVLAWLSDRIGDCRWLTPEEKARLRANLEREGRGKIGTSLRDAFTLPIVWVLCLIDFCIGLGIYGMGFWLPTLIQEAGVKGLSNVGLFSAIPYGAAGVAMVWIAHVADNRRQRRGGIAVAIGVGAITLSLSVMCKGDAVVSIAALTVATAAILTGFAQFWRLPIRLLGDNAAAAGIALISSVANLSGFVSPYLIGWLRDTTGSGALGIYFTAGSLVLASVITMLIPSRLVS